MNHGAKHPTSHNSNPAAPIPRSSGNRFCELRCLNDNALPNCLAWPVSDCSRRLTSTDTCNGGMNGRDEAGIACARHCAPRAHLSGCGAACTPRPLRTARLPMHTSSLDGWRPMPFLDSRLRSRYGVCCRARRFGAIYFTRLASAGPGHQSGTGCRAAARVASDGALTCAMAVPSRDRDYSNAMRRSPFGSRRSSAHSSTFSSAHGSREVGPTSSQSSATSQCLNLDQRRVVRGTPRQRHVPPRKWVGCSNATRSNSASMARRSHASRRLRPRGPHTICRAPSARVVGM